MGGSLNFSSKKVPLSLFVNLTSLPLRKGENLNLTTKISSWKRPSNGFQEEFRKEREKGKRSFSTLRRQKIVGPEASSEAWLNQRNTGYDISLSRLSCKRRNPRIRSEKCNFFRLKSAFTGYRFIFVPFALGKGKKKKKEILRKKKEERKEGFRRGVRAGGEEGKKRRYPRRERGINLSDVADASMNTGASILCAERNAFLWISHFRKWVPST